MVANRRRASGLSQLQLAYEVGTSPSAISRVERGHYRVSLHTLNRIAWALNSQVAVGLFDLDADLPSRKLVGALPPDRQG
jgi:UDP-N-acetylglucosamine 1-carboxyvinyltransferase